MRDLGVGSAEASNCMNRAKRFGGLTGYPSASPPVSRVVVGFHTLVAREPLLAAIDLLHRWNAGRIAHGRWPYRCRTQVLR